MQTWTISKLHWNALDYSRPKARGLENFGRDQQSSDVAFDQPQSQTFVFGYHQHLETCHFEKGVRISFRSRDHEQDLHVVPENAFTKRTATA